MMTSSPSTSLCAVDASTDGTPSCLLPPLLSTEFLRHYYYFGNALTMTSRQRH
jgi:hypothetical protein